MVEIPDVAIGSVVKIPPVAPFLTPEELLADVLPLLDPPSRISVTEAAERYMRVNVAGMWQAFDRSVAPYMVEPTDITQSRRFRAVCFIGPSQCGKTKMLETVAMHAVTCDPGPIQVIHMTKSDADAWVEEKLDPTIMNSPAIYELLGKGREDSTFSRKRFRGMLMRIGYPVANQLSGRTQRAVLLTDYDHMPQRLGPKDSPEGSPYKMARQRTKTFMSRGIVLVEGTPAFPVTDAEWSAPKDAPHALPPVVSGIAQIYNEGTRARWYWQCPECDDLFEPRFDRLVYDETLSPGAAGETAEMKCPHCGSLIAHRFKSELNRAALKGRGGWLHEGLDGQLVAIADPAIRQTDVASYSLNGAAATFSTWPELVAHYETALRRFREDGDETDLGQVHYTDIGVPYTPRYLDGSGDLDLQALKNNQRPFERGIAPSWTRFITVSVDVQATRFPVQVTAWGPHGLRTIIDRFDLFTPPEQSPGAEDRTMDPARYIEDWAVLLDLAERSWRVQGADYALKAVALAVDFQGLPGVSDNAEKFWRARRKAGQSGRWYLTRGHGGLNQRERVWYETPDRGSKGKKARGVKLLNMAVDRLKDSVVAALGRTDDGVNAFPLPDWLEQEHLAEFVAEQRTLKGWEKRPGKVRNESLDLSVQALALATFKGLERVRWDDPPAWAVGGSENSFAVPDGTQEKPKTTRRRIPRRLF